MSAAALAAPRRRAGLWKWLAAAFLAVLAVIAGDYIRSHRAGAAPLDPAEIRPGFGPKNFAEALVGSDRGVGVMRERLARHPDDWLHGEGGARALTARYRLTGSPADLAEANRMLDRAIGQAPWPAGPALSRAAVSLSLHDLAGAEAGLTRFDAFVVPAAAEEQLEARSIRCEIAFQRGELAEARRLCGEGDSLGLKLRRANMAAKSGDTAAAALIVEDLLRRPRQSPSTLAVLSLQRASIALARGDWQASGRWARAAERVFPGYWLSEAFVAQQFALEGDLAEARRRFTALAARTGNPDVMDALAALAEAEGRHDEARGWVAKAGVAWHERMRLLPLAYATHNAEYTLSYGDPQVALALAREEYRRRPFSTPAANYARALLHHGRAREALDVLKRARAAGWLTAPMAIEESQALQALGRTGEAREALQQARALNPNIDQPGQSFVFFDQD